MGGEHRRGALLQRPGRLIGLDVARTIALVGMVATHVVPTLTETGAVTLAHQVASGRAAALFAVLAGVGLALVSGGRRTLRGGALRRARVGIAARALLIGALGLALGGLDTRIAVILAYYALMFVLALPFLRLGARALAGWAVAVALVVPVVSQFVRPELSTPDLATPTFASLADPGAMLVDLALTGFYPALPWLAYLLAGLALGRCDLADAVVQRRLVVGGVALAAAATLVSRIATATSTVREALFPGALPLPEGEAMRLLDSGLFGTTPAGEGVSWWWLVVVSPHSGTPLDLAATTGTALAVIGACLWLVARVPRRVRGIVVLLAGAGAAPLTCYALHVVAMTPDVPPGESPADLGAQVLLLAVVGGAIALTGRRGPLETLAGAPGRLLAARSR